MRRHFRWLSAGIIIDLLADVATLSYILGMAQMTVLLPDDLQRWADARSVEGGFSSTGDYIGELMRRDREDAEKLAALQAAIDAGRASGVSARDPFDYLNELCAGSRAQSPSADAA